MTQYKGYFCTPGYYCPAGSSSSIEMPCPEGTYSDSYEIFDASQCYVCPAGYKCPEATSSLTGMIACPLNQFCIPGTKSSVTMKCPAGSYAPYTNSKSMDDCIPCPYGSYCLSGENPATCPMGYYCPKSTEYANQYPCPAGFYLDKYGGKVLGECRACGIGNYCPEGSSTPVPCPAGTYNNVTNVLEKCYTCPAGKYCPLGTDFPLKCAAGTYSTTEQSSCSFCNIGTYCPNEATTEDEMKAQLCPAGVYCSRTVSVTVDGASLVIPVGLDVYPNLRDHYCSSGYYCPEGTTQQLECPAGTYNRLKGRKNRLDCQMVQAGYYVSTTAASDVSGPCDTGYYCPEGSTSSKQVPCPAGTFRMITGGEKPEDCG